jgi:hypothetical protein
MSKVDREDSSQWWNKKQRQDIVLPDEIADTFMELANEYKTDVNDIVRRVLRIGLQVLYADLEGVTSYHKDVKGNMTPINTSSYLDTNTEDDEF